MTIFFDNDKILFTLQNKDEGLPIIILTSEETCPW